jgi:hypothetical protein
MIGLKPIIVPQHAKAKQPLRSKRGSPTRFAALERIVRLPSCFAG